MIAKTSSINGITRLHEFEIDINDFERIGATVQASARRSKLGFKPGEFPDSFSTCIGFFRLFEIRKSDRARVYFSDRDGYCRFTIKTT